LRCAVLYLETFGDQADVGLTGTFQTLDPVSSADYFVAHGASLYFIGRTRAIGGYRTWADDTPLIIHN
jgi:hypothetical protein